MRGEGGYPGSRSRASQTLGAAARSVACGGVAFLVIAAVAEAIGFAEWLALHRPFGFRFPLKIGWLYFLSFHRVGMQVSAPDLSSLVGAGAPRLITYRVHLALLLGTTLVLFALYRAGRAAAGPTGGNLRRVVQGALVAVGYAIPTFVGTLPVALRLPTSGVSIRPVAWEAFAIPLMAGVLAGAAGGLSEGWSDDRSPIPRAWLVGGWRMFATAVVLAFAGAIALAGLRPDGAATYWRLVSGDGLERAALLVSHHALLLPNQSVLLLAPAMGACDVERSAAKETDLLCFGRQPIVEELARLGVGRAPAGGDGVPDVYYLFVLVPAAAVLEGGRFAGALDGGRRRWLVGVGAGVVFAILFTVASVASTISITAPAATKPLSFVPLSIGPDIPTAAAFALVWGITGGAVGSLLVGRQRAEPPSPTSV